MLPFIIAGLVSGAVYGLIGVGLVLTYRTSGVFNFAYGALATVAAYLYYFLHVQHGVPVALALVVAIVVLSAALGFGFERFAEQLSRISLSLQIAATVGVVLIVESLASLLFGENPLSIPAFLPTSTFRLAGTNVGYDQLIVFAISAAAAAFLYLFLKRTRTGKAMQAVVDNPELLDLAGTNPVVVRRAAWTISALLVTLSGLLLVPGTGVTPTNLTLLVIQGFGAAAIGAFTNIYLAWAGGLVIGVAASLITKYVSSTSILGGLAASVPFIVLFCVILFLPRRRLVNRAVPRARSLGSSWTMPGAIQLMAGGAVLALLCLVPGFVGFRLGGWTTSLTYVVVLLSLGLLVRTSGQVSLCHVTFAAIGAVAFSKLTTGLGLPWLPGLLVAGLIAVPIGALLAVPAIRLSGVYLAVATFGFGLLVQNMFYQTNVMFGTTNLGVTVPAPSIPWLHLGPDKLLYYVVLAITVVTALAIVLVTRTRLGRLLRALSDSPVGLAALGTDVTVTRVVVFCVSAFIAAIGGALLGAVQSQASGLAYDPTLSLTYVALIVITIGSEPWYALIAAVGFGIIPTYISGGNVTYYLQLVFGVFAVLVAVTPQPHLPAGWRRGLDRIGRRGRWPVLRGASPHVREDGARTLPHRRETETALEVSDLRVRFGGLTAVDAVTLAAPSGRITGLIGPNGAGKTTTFNACSGIVRPTTGSVVLGGRDISRYGPARRARLGLGRTFQEMRLFDTLSVSANIALGREAALAGANPVTQIATRRGESGAIQARVRDAIRLCGLYSLADAVVGDLSTGERRLVELARCFAGDYDIVLLDEPSSGLDRSETKQVGEVLTRIVADRGMGILLVEHDMALVMDVCSYIYVLDFGQMIFEGAAEQVRASEVVQAAYLGSDTLESVAR
jgi:ABC-type branched-subunit amino acid transport system ATPase component/branched-subunit amino acid ABC-type transport system permease component